MKTFCLEFIQFTYTLTSFTHIYPSHIDRSFSLMCINQISLICFHSNSVCVICFAVQNGCTQQKFTRRRLFYFYCINFDFYCICFPLLVGFRWKIEKSKVFESGYVNNNLGSLPYKLQLSPIVIRSIKDLDFI